MRQKAHRYLPALIFGIAAVAVFLILPQSGLSAARGPVDQTVLADKKPNHSLSPNDLTPVPTLTPTATTTATHPVYQYFPFIENAQTPALVIDDFYTHDAAGIRRSAYLPGEFHTYLAEGVNNRMIPLTATLHIIQTSICGDSLIYSGTLSLPAGDWQLAVGSPGVDCTGIYTTTVSLEHEHLSPTINHRHVVNPPSTVLVSGFQGFDRCHLPSVDEMQAWWDSSPYYVYNLYLGGISFFCWEEIPDPVWVHQVAEQGWTFIQGWVGPQAPCSGFAHRMSGNAGVAYLEGRAEAAAAAEASRRAGLFENGVIYYDIEGFPNASSSCRNAVYAFLRGWTEQLHELGLKSGSYGSPCNSYMTDWASINPPPDDVWIAHWYRPSYDPAATVWDTPCLSNNLWAGHKRIKQYAGDHVETWGEVSLTIDTDVLDGEITGLPLNLVTAEGVEPQVTIKRYGKRMSALGLLGPGQGWMLAEGRLQLTLDGGGSWEDITPPGLDLLDVEFLDIRRGWAVGRLVTGPQLEVARTVDGGATWSISTLPGGHPEEMAEIQTGWLASLDEQTAWVSFKLQSGGSFSLGRLFATTDGGRVWEERSAPFGAPVAFVDERHGWTTSGPGGDRLFGTQDGGNTWFLQPLNLPGDMPARLGLPQFSGGQTGWLPVLLDKAAGPGLAFLATTDGGESWRFQRERPSDPSLVAEFLLGASGGESWSAPASMSAGLPSGSIVIDFFDRNNGWVIVQQGACTGKPDAFNDENYEFPGRVTCEQVWRLLGTQDGGLSWREISP